MTDRFSRAFPFLFVVLWSTGFIGARLGLPHIEPLTFLLIRYLVVIGCMVVLALAFRAPWPQTPSAWLHIGIAGLLMHGVYLGGLFLASSWGMPTGIGSLIASLHPVITAVASRGVLGERLQRVQWLGIGLGFAGVVAVVIDHFIGASAGLSAGMLLASSCSVLGMSAGTLVQRRRGGTTPLPWGTAMQYLAAASVLALGALVHTDEGFHVTARSLFALAWAVGVLSIAAVLIMLWLLQREAAAQVSSLFFLTPALSTVEGAILFGERMGVLAVVGLVVALAGVSLTLRSTR